MRPGDDRYRVSTSDFKGERAHVQTMGLSITLNHNRAGLRTLTAKPPHTVFVASRAEQIAEHSAELFHSVRPCRTWRGPFSQHDSALQNGATLYPGPLNNKSREEKRKRSLTLTFNLKKKKDIGDSRWKGPLP